MNARELMIGDLVNLSPGKANIPNYVMIHAIEYDNHVSKDYVFDIVFLSTGLVQYNYSIRSLNPIPLNPEILEKNGFEKDPESGELIWTDDDVTEVVWVGTILTIRGEYANAEFATCMFVHQLQHAIRLCGIKKEIVL